MFDYRHIILFIVLAVLTGCGQVKQGDISDVDEIALAGEMVLIPGGTFMMGDMSGEGWEDEKPVHSVTVPDFRLGKYEVTASQWHVCVADGGCDYAGPFQLSPSNHPVTNVSWDDVQAFINWLNSKTGGGYRLPTEAEWEYAARAGSTTKYFFGNDKSRLCDYANHRHFDNDCFDSVFGRWLSDRVKGTAEVGSYQPNVFGLYDMYGNVREWVQDCWNENYEGAPSDGSAWESGDCSVRVLRGGHWHSKPKNLRSSYRSWAGHAYDIGIGGMLRTLIDIKFPTSSWT